jgi:hypothetical protein
MVDPNGGGSVRAGSVCGSESTTTGLLLNNPAYSTTGTDNTGMHGRHMMPNLATVEEHDVWHHSDTPDTPSSVTHSVHQHAELFQVMHLDYWQSSFVGTSH